MATFSLYDVHETYCSWSISGMSLDWNANNYLCAGVSMSPANGTTTPPSGILTVVYPPASGSSRSVAGVVSGLQVNTTYTLYGFAQTLDGRYYNAGSATITTLNVAPPSSVFASVNDLTINISFSKAAGAVSTTLEIWIYPESVSTYSTSGTSFSINVGYYNTTYYYRLRSVAANLSVSDWTPTYSIATSNPPPPPIPSAGVTINYKFEGGLNVSWGSSPGATSYTLRYRHYSGVYSYITGITSTSYSLSGLEYGVSYYLSVCAVNDYGSSGYTPENRSTTLPQTPTISKVSGDVSSVTIHIGSISGNYDVVRVYKYEDSVQVGYIDSIANSDVTFSGLLPDKTYIFKARTRLTVDSVLLESYYYSNEITHQTTGRPENWEWTSSFASGGEVYNTVFDSNTNTIIAYILPATEWNNFCSRINEFRLYKGLSNYSFTNVTSNMDFTASIFNEAISAMSSLSSYFTGGNTIPLPVSSSGDIYANYFIQLQNALNSIE